MAGEQCSKCGSEPRATSSSWGKACLAAAAKARRLRRGATSVATRDTTDRATHADCEKRITELGEEVARLTRQLAAGAEAPGPSTPAHGPRCACLACQSMRWPGH
jgi:hypothetical protein